MNSDTSTSLKTKQRVFHQRVQYLYQGGLRAVSFNIINASLLLGVYWFQLPLTQLVIWFIVLTLISVARISHISLSLEKEWKISKNRQKLHVFRIGALVTGATWGAGFIFLSPGLNDTYTLLFLFTLAGMCSGALSSMASDRLTYLFYILPMLIPAMLITVLQGNLLSLVMTVMLILFTIMLAVSHKLAVKTFAEGLEYRFEHEDLVKELLSANNALTATNAELERAKEDLRELSLYDELTRVPNRRYFMQVLERETHRAKREQIPLSAIMIDVDEFKNYNDTYGHSKGDQCLRTIAEYLQNALQRSSDFFARYGGEEFVALLPNTTQENALIVAERMRMSIFNAELEHSGYAKGKVTVSAGIACCSAGHGWKSCQSLIDSADRSLYQAKQAGRNQVVTQGQQSVVVSLLSGESSTDVKS
ncbi:GGDEF domain-containing protein [Candidatus Thiodiazotropha sp. CDECU1]|uniref:GGDEF domain-containing protein n=1 Tax=Candidatus Thiodiazotropha sp. CDECU1 TaxID=3065865 RepID=UPI00292FAD1B|nr:GGDEF domain-containing protein [Candidatus Thiodiazotropha sp. CDECU1]